MNENYTVEIRSQMTDIGMAKNGLKLAEIRKKVKKPTLRLKTVKNLK